MCFFFSLFFPLLDLSVLAFRAFFLWFAADQAVTAASKAKTYLQPIEIRTTGADSKIAYPSACDSAAARANQVKLMLSGIHWQENDNNPSVQIVRHPINARAKDALPAHVFFRGHGAPLEAVDAPDSAKNIYTCRRSN